MTGSSVAWIPGETGEDRAGRCLRTQYPKLSPRTYLPLHCSQLRDMCGHGAHPHRCSGRAGHAGAHACRHTPGAPTGTWEYTQTWVHPQKLSGTHKHMGHTHANPHHSVHKAHGWTRENRQTPKREPTHGHRPLQAQPAASAHLGTPGAGEPQLCSPQAEAPPWCPRPPLCTPGRLPVPQPAKLHFLMPPILGPRLGKAKGCRLL